MLLLNAAIDPGAGGSDGDGPGRTGGAGRRDGGRGAVGRREIRTGARVARILVSEGRAVGVVLESGEEIAGAAVISNADPRRTLLGLVDPVELDPGFLTKVRNYRARGTVAKVHLALGALPVFRGVAERQRPSRPHPDRAGHRLSRARVRRLEVRRDPRASRTST